MDKIKIQQTQSEKEGWSIVKALAEILKNGGKVRSGYVSDDMGMEKGNKRFIINVKESEQKDS